MDAPTTSQPAGARNPVTVQRTSDREITVTRIFNAPARFVFEAWTTPELFKKQCGCRSPWDDASLPGDGRAHGRQLPPRLR